MPANTYGRQVVVPLTNKSGGAVAAGDVVIVDTSNNEAFTTTTSGAYTGGIGIAQETIANNAIGRVLVEGYAALVNTSASVTRGNYGKTHTVAKQAVDAGASRVAGAFCQFLTGGTTPTARIFPPDLGAAAGNVAADAIFDAKGDLPVGTGADTAAKLTVGTNDFFPVADSAAATGIRWNGRASCRKASDEAKSATAYADSTSMSLPLVANKNYRFRFVIFYTTNSTGVGIKLAIQGPASCLAYAGVLGAFTLGTATSAASILAGVQASGDISTDLAMMTPASGPGGTATMVIIEGVINNGANAGNLKLRHGSSTATATTILANSHGELEEIA
jgi:hypothetical protein